MSSEKHAPPPQKTPGADAPGARADRPRETLPNFSG